MKPIRTLRIFILLFFCQAQAHEFSLYAPTAYRPHNLLQQNDDISGGIYDLKIQLDTDTINLPDNSMLFLHLPGSASILNSSHSLEQVDANLYQLKLKTILASKVFEYTLAFENTIQPSEFRWAYVAQDQNHALLHAGSHADFTAQALKLFTQQSIEAASPAETPIQIVTSKTSITSSLHDWSSLRNHNLIRQQYDYSCGAASTATILKYFYNADVNEQSVLHGILATKGTLEKDAKQLEHSDYFLSFEDIKNYTQTIGYKAMGLAVSLETLGKLKTPALVHVKIRNNEHFSVYRGMDQQFVYLADPSFGNIKVSIHKFEDMFFNRSDLQHPGRILVFVPLDHTRKAAINSTFMNTDNNSQIYQSVLHHHLHSTRP